METNMSAIVAAVSRSRDHTFSKMNEPMIRLVAGLGVESDAHLGEKVTHRYHAQKNPDAPNLRQVHLMHEELFAELRAAGFDICAGAIGENITTRGLDILALPTGARLRLGTEALIEVMGLRNPCRQIDAFQPGLRAALLKRDSAGHLLRKAGIMAIVLRGGDVKPGDAVTVEFPAGEHRPLQPI
jgi:MOSC domain-containing protein YiiM